jgi:hypothetical protein
MIDGWNPTDATGENEKTVCRTKDTLRLEDIHRPGNMVNRLF